MANRRLPMRKIKEILRLHFQARLSARQIARSCSVSRATVGDYLSRTRAAQLDWKQVAQMSEAELEGQLFPPPAPRGRHRPPPDLAYVHRELRGKSVTLQLLWQEYKQVHADGYQYSQFCDLYNRWRGKLDVVLRQNHRAGEKMFVDYAGQTVEIVDPKTGEMRQASIFVAVLGASNYTYAEATESQNLQSWIGAHVRAVEFFGGTTRVVIPDNTRTAVSQACFYEPQINPSYAEWAAHYSVAVIPARVRAPRDKGKVESAVLVVERWILAALRKRRFFSLGELNEAIHELLGELNRRPFRKLEGNRLELFRRLDQPALRPLPRIRYQLARWKKARVNIDYHVEFERHYYSVELLGELNRRPFRKLEGNRLELFRRLDQPALRPLPRIRYQLARWKKARVNIDYHVEFERHYYSPLCSGPPAGRDPLHGTHRGDPAPGPAGGLASSQPRVRSRLYLLRAPSTVSPALSGVVSFAVDLLGCQDRTPLW